MKSDRKLAGMLVKRGLLTKEQRDEVMAEADANGKSLSEILVGRKMLQESDIVACLSEQTNLPPIDVSKVKIEDSLSELISAETAREHLVLPVARIGKILTVAVADPFDVMVMDHLRLNTGHEPMMAVSSEMAIRGAIQETYNKVQTQMDELLGEDDESLELAAEEAEVVDVDKLTEEGKEKRVVRLLNLIVLEAIRERASDIHIEPFEKTIRVRYRIDGALQERSAPPKPMLPKITSRVKIMTKSMDIAERHKPQDGKFQLIHQGRQIDFRVSILPTIFGEKTVIRILDTENLAHSLDSLGFEEKALKDFRDAVVLPYGIVLVTGPTGSGKSTTLYSAITEIMDVEDNITTVEDPVEYQIAGINQVQVEEKRGLTFAGALRSLMRQDPDKILIGEVRDLETAEIAIRAALTGHLVLSTLHTNDAASTVSRLIDMGIDPFMVAQSAVLVSAQRLVRKLCSECKEETKPGKDEFLRWGFTESEAGSKPTIYKAKGCGRCVKGYKGRTALLETLPVTDEIRRIITDGGGALAVKKQSLEDGMLTLRRVGLLNVLKGITSVKEVLGVSMRDA